jgi:hypothetical protein
MPGVVKLPYTRRVRRIPIVEEVEHALTQLEIQSNYPGRQPYPDLPLAETNEWPSIHDEE